MKLERSENVKIINGYLKDNCRFQLDSIAEDSIYRDITATGRTYLYTFALNVQITYLRKMLEADTSISIISLKKRGYILEVNNG